MLRNYVNRLASDVRSVSLFMETPMNTQFRPGFRSLFALFLLAIGPGLLINSGCTAEDVIKQGAEGEYCNGIEDDCRPGLACINSICQGLANDSTCGTICDRLADCGRNQTNCEVACDNTIRQWGEQQVEDFAACMTEDLSCEEIQAADEPPQECYNRLALPNERSDRCEDFVVAAQECGVTDTDILRRECRYMARTRSEDYWALSDECVARVADGVCPDIVTCLNDVFDIDPPL